MKKNEKKQLAKKLSLRRESLSRLEPRTLKEPVAAGVCLTYYCRSGDSCLCSSS